MGRGRRGGGGGFIRCYFIFFFCFKVLLTLLYHQIYLIFMFFFIFCFGFFKGPMFSGKTTRLLNYVSRWHNSFEHVKVAKWSEDLRSGSNHTIRTHDGAVLNKFISSVPRLKDLQLPRQGRLLLAIDEAQFFGKDLIDIWSSFEERSQSRISSSFENNDTRKDIMLVAGLNLDYRREKFGYILDLIEMNKHKNNMYVDDLTAKCYCCSKPASYTMRTSSLSVSKIFRT